MGLEHLAQFARPQPGVAVQQPDLCPEVLAVEAGAAQMLLGHHAAFPALLPRAPGLKFVPGRVWAAAGAGLVLLAEMGDEVASWASVYYGSSGWRAKKWEAMGLTILTMRPCPWRYGRRAEA